MGGAIVYEGKEETANKNIKTANFVTLKGDVTLYGDFNSAEKIEIKKSAVNDAVKEVAKKKKSSIKFCHKKNYSGAKNKYFICDKNSNDLSKSTYGYQTVASAPNSNYKASLIAVSTFFTETQILYRNTCNEFETQFIPNDFYSSLYCRPPPSQFS